MFAKNNYAVAIILAGTEWHERKVSIWDWESGIEVTSVPAYYSADEYIVCDRNSNNILVGNPESSMCTLRQLVFNEDAKTLEITNYRSMGLFGRGLKISPDGQHAAYICERGTITDVDATQITNELGEWFVSGSTAAAFSNDSKYIIFANASSLELFDVTTHKFIKSIDITSSIQTVGISKGNKIALKKGMLVKRKEWCFTE